MNYWLKWLLINIAALAAASVIGLIALSQVYVLKITVARNPAAPFVLAFIVSLIVAFSSPATRFKPRFIVLSSIFLGEFVLSFAATHVMLLMIRTYWGGDVEAFKPWAYAGLLVPFITGVTGFLILRRYRLPDVAEVFR
ncbi:MULTISPECIES: hypothetical protein [unclassified Mesorhizobium]|uniref:hypothetical protein n=1 Tax=unclassified Mesorhizobium TaxID=325217 RepID=UPI00112AE225|nr:MULTISPECIES: hypothetical protein [unclassified Mesorhizobium]TPL00277.1 hypothetical protein FJ567_15120 [Mesorhizobium sp. B2-4-16]TPL66283.1 hypothetical protein FJ956_19925 [Mesorhizobium sp. B2-4-3]